MAANGAYPIDGRITSLAAFTGLLTGAELFMIASPASPSLAVNYQLTASTLAQLVASSFNPVTANYVFAGPVSGGTATPTFRAEVLADLPQGAANYVLTGNGTGSAPSYQPVGTIQPTVLTTNAATHNMSTSDFVILFERPSAFTATLNLLPGSTWANRDLVVMALDASAATTPVWIVAASGETISGLGSTSINAAYGGFRLTGLTSGGSYISP